MKLFSILLLFISLNVNAEEILLSSYMSETGTSSPDSFIVRIEPNNELILPLVMAVYGLKPNQQKLRTATKINNGMDIVIPKKKDGKEIEKLIFYIDQLGSVPISQNSVGFVSMWASYLPVKLIHGKKNTRHIINYGLQQIGFHGSHPFFRCDERSKPNYVEVSINALTTIKLSPADICRD